MAFMACQVQRRCRTVASLYGVDIHTPTAEQILYKTGVAMSCAPQEQFGLILSRVPPHPLEDAHGFLSPGAASLFRSPEVHQKESLPDLFVLGQRSEVSAHFLCDAQLGRTEKREDVKLHFLRQPREHTFFVELCILKRSAS